MGQTLTSWTLPQTLGQRLVGSGSTGGNRGPRIHQLGMYLYRKCAVVHSKETQTTGSVGAAYIKPRFKLKAHIVALISKSAGGKNRALRFTRFNNVGIRIGIPAEPRIEVCRPVFIEGKAVYRSGKNVAPHRPGGGGAKLYIDPFGPAWGDKKAEFSGVRVKAKALFGYPVSLYRDGAFQHVGP